MSKKRTIKKFSVLLSCVTLCGLLLAGCGGGTSESGKVSSSNSAGGSGEASQEKVNLSLLIDSGQDTVNTAKALVEAFEAKYPNITIDTETRPGGSEGDNFVKTRLATEDMNDIFIYNSGSLLQALNPEKNLLDLTNEPFQANVIDSFKPTVSFNQKIYGAPVGSTMAGGWLYNKKVYAKLGLSVPKTWEELKANNDKIKAAGITPIIGTFKDAWSSQMIVLADYYNVQAQVPNFAADYTANKAKFASTPAALRSFQKLADTVGYYNKDFLAATYDSGLKMLAEGKGAQYPMVSFAIPTIIQNNPELIDDIGFFAQPGDQPDQNGATVWMPFAAYVYKNTEHAEEAKKFVNFIASIEGVEAISKVSKPSGPYAIKGAALPSDTPQVVKDMLPYFDEGKTAPALEFLSPVKGPNLEQITVEVGAGKRNAADAAELYDKDVEKQAQQLGLEGW
ncbi:ABC transporter substrate-binding protein [Paenibacillus silvae]|uniref:Carbohydrate ABC transporter substrate-binding protein n=1 Tax=Paenibacillus silvae TaxID=1325358 RepID=A0A2W6NIA9_9BACL|nr:extracellular solute-binding protein [Paenibacillus silvae]PZT55677.1 carbohydrate ABC transporter substrate-binding protein [Paenibacillus silvae]